jgi:hypothetical protein
MNWTPKYFGKIILGQGQAHAEHNDAQQRHDIGGDPAELVGRYKGKNGEQQYPDGKCFAHELAQASNSLHDENILV